MRILLIEDDYQYSEEVRLDLSELMDAGGPLKIDVITNEREFREQFNRLADCGYDLAIVNIMVKWERPNAEKKRPDEDVLTGGYYRAGFRCLDLLRRDPRTARLNVVVHSNLDAVFMKEFIENYINEYTKFVKKSGTAEDLLSIVRSWTPETLPRG